MKPDLSTCGPAEGGASAEIERKAPLELPPTLSSIAASDFGHFAFLTRGGGTVCVDTSWMEGTNDMTLSSDGNFVTFKWYGYEDYGAKLVDLRGGGAVVETGEIPVRGPSGKLIAAVEYSESGFGSLNALGIWNIAASPAQGVAIVEFPDGYTGWRLDGWGGDECLSVSATTFDRLAEEGAQRDRFVSRADKDWQVVPAGEKGCAAR